MSKREYPKVKYADVRNEMQTGDILLFKGTGLVSGTIRFMTKSDSSHIGEVFRDEVNDIVNVFESTTLIRGIKGSISGVNINPLYTRLKTAGCKVTWRKLCRVDRDAQFQETFKDFRFAMRDKLYEKNMLELALSAVDPKVIPALDKLHNKSDDTTVFCSELITLGYQAWNLISNNILANETVPADFGDENKFIDKYKIGNWYLEPEVELIL